MERCWFFFKQTSWRITQYTKHSGGFFCNLKIVFQNRQWVFLVLILRSIFLLNVDHFEEQERYYLLMGKTLYIITWDGNVLQEYSKVKIIIEFLRTKTDNLKLILFGKWHKVFIMKLAHNLKNWRQCYTESNFF